VSIAQDIQRIIAKHYGELHPFTIESGNLNKINQGFLTGFIDLFFEYNGKYYVLDYKTNSLESYTSCADTTLIDNPLLQETASSHYYLQYLLYLVALKRYLEFKLKIEDASSLLGGSLYYYVRGIFVTNDVQGGVFIDAHCQTIVAELDELFK
jgi:exodeoxyribonuclease V beta subunit